MKVNFIGPLIILTGIASIVGLILGLVKKNKKVTKISLIVFLMIATIFFLEFFVTE